MLAKGGPIASVNSAGDASERKKADYKRASYAGVKSTYRKKSSLAGSSYLWILPLAALLGALSFQIINLYNGRGLSSLDDIKSSLGILLKTTSSKSSSLSRDERGELRELRRYFDLGPDSGETELSRSYRLNARKTSSGCQQRQRKAVCRAYKINTEEQKNSWNLCR